MRPTTAVGTEAASVLDGFADHINVLLDTQYDLMDGGHHWTPVAASPLEYARAAMKRHYGPGGDWDGAEAEQAGRLVTLLLGVAGQHLEGIRALLSSRHVVFSVAPLARCVVEAAGEAFWLAGGQLASPRDRAARVWMTRLHDATRRVTTAKAFDIQDTLEGVPHAKKQVRNLEALVKDKDAIRKKVIPSRFYPSEIENREGELTLRGQQRPGLSGSLKFIAEALGVVDSYTPMYSFLSDATHPTPYAIVETLQPASEVHSDLHRFGSTDLRREYVTTRAAVVAYQQLWLLSTAYFGLDTAEVIRVCDKIDAVPRPPGIEGPE